MSTEEYGFYFEQARLGSTQGAIASAEQFFEGSHAEASLVRETGQNSLDARDGSELVTMIFELATMRTEDIPGIDDLRLHIAQSAQETRGTQGHDRMQLAADTARGEEIMVLRISDYGTVGLAGSESLDDPKSPLSALTRGAGISADDGTRGGSFGIGSAVGPMSSEMCTVLYTSLPKGSQDVVFAGYSRLASHRDETGAWRVGDGFFTALGSQSDFKYLRNPKAIGPFSPRDQYGTDIYILGYRKAANDAQLVGVRHAFLDNFLAAIHRGRLRVIGRANGMEWTLDKDSLAKYVSESPEARSFYEALNDPSPVETSLGRFGNVKLYINVDDSLERSLHTRTMRAPLMKIDTFKHTSIPIKYAAILECSDDKGNTLLRALEPPQHDRWDPARSADGPAAVRELKTFVKESLKARIADVLGDQVEIKGLAKFLPIAAIPEIAAADSTTGTPFNGEGRVVEGSTVHGDPHPQLTPIPVQQRRSVQVSVRTSAVSEGNVPTTKGKDAGGEGQRSSRGGNLKGEGQTGSGSSRIDVGKLTFRSWTDSASGSICLALLTSSDVEGDLELVALGPGGASEDDYTLPLSSAHIEDGDKLVAVAHAGNVLRNLKLTAGKRTLIRLDLSHARRYRLGVK